jgi:membrane-associated phospholipid phosphatase
MARRIALTFVVLPLVFALLTAIGVGLGWIAVHELGRFELPADQWMAAHRSPVLTGIMLGFTTIAGEQAVIVLVAIAVVVLLVLRQVADAVGVALSAAGMLTMYEIVVRWIGRHRPPVVRIDDPGGSSFPSGHVANSTALYVALLIALYLVTRRRGLLSALSGVAAVLLTGIAVSRVYLGLHYPSDVVAGFLLGLGWALSVGRTVDEISLPRRVSVRR